MSSDDSLQSNPYPAFEHALLPAQRFLMLDDATTEATVSIMKTAEYLIAEKAWPDRYEAPGDSARLKQFVTDRWKTSPVLEHYADTYLPKESIDLGPFILLSAERIEKENDWDGGELLSSIGLLEIGGTVGSDYLFMLVDTGKVLFLDVSDIPTIDMREANYDSTEIKDFDLTQWLGELEARGPDLPLFSGVFASFADFDEAFLAWHQETKDGNA